VTHYTKGLDRHGDGGFGRAMHRDDALAFMKYLLRPESNAMWKTKGLERFN